MSVHLGSVGAGSVMYQARQWFALRVKPRHEKAVGACLAAKTLPQLVPLYKSTRRWSDRDKVVDLPLFPGYVFCHFGFAERLHVLQTPGVRGIVGSRSGPIPVREEEMTAITTIVTTEVQAEPTDFVYEGQRVSVARGPLKGVQGFLQEVRSKKRFVVSVFILQRSVAVEVDAASIVPLLPGAFSGVSGGIAQNPR
jgi:transcription antitermination factor NusG